MLSTTEELAQLLDVLPAVVRTRLERDPDVSNLIEIVLDYGRPAEARFRDRVERMADVIVTEHDIDFVTKSIGEFGTDNRAGIERTLHRISCIRNRHGKPVGLTCRVGRALEGTIDMIDDIIRSGQSILFLGKPGIGKTTKLRECARILADEVNKRVVIVDTSNEIAGDGDIPHPGIGAARRMQVRIAAEQHQVMIEAVENHMPEVIVIDEIGTEQEAMAARTIAERGVQLVGTAHGQSLENLMLNPTLCDLIGGIQAVTLSDDEARRRGTQKTVLERKAPPTFDIIVELIDYERLAVHHNVQKTVDLILRGIAPRPEVRVRTGAGKFDVIQAPPLPEEAEAPESPKFPSLSRKTAEPKLTPILSDPAEKPLKPAATQIVKIYPYGIARTRLERAIREKRAPATISSDINHADAIMAIRTSVQNKPRKLKDITGKSVPTVVVKSNTFAQISQALDDILRGAGQTGVHDSDAMDEAISAVETVMASGKPFELAPRSASVRKMQHQVIEARRLASESVGHEPNRRLRVLPIRLG